MKSQSNANADDESPWSLLLRASRKLAESFFGSIREMLPSKASEVVAAQAPPTKSPQELIDLAKTIPPPTADSRYRYISFELKQFGPLNAEELRMAVTAGKVGPDTFVNLNGASDFFPAWVVPTIFPASVVNTKVNGLKQEIRMAYEMELKELQDRFERSPLLCFEKFVKEFEPRFLRRWRGFADGARADRVATHFQARLAESGVNRIKAVVSFSGPTRSRNETAKRYEIVFASSDGVWAPINASGDFTSSNAMFSQESDMLDLASEISAEVQKRWLDSPD